MAKKIKKLKKKRKLPKRFKKVVKKPRKILVKKTTTRPLRPPAKRRAPIKPLKRAKRAKLKKPSKPAELLVKKAKPVKQVKPQKPKLVKPMELPVSKTKIKVIGIGGGGSSIISEMAPKIKKANFVAANTDLQALKEVGKRAIHFQFGQRLTQGLGTGMNPELGEQAAQDAKEKIKKIIEGQDLCILVSCLGGGTGSGAAPVFAKISKKLGNITFGIFTLPFEFEGKKRMEIAKTSLEKLTPNVNALVLIPNQKIFQIIDTKTPLKEAFSTINKMLAGSLEGLIELIYSSGLINIDFADLKSILGGKEKLTFLNTIETKTPTEIEEIAKKILSNPLYSYSAQGAKGILFNITGGENLSLDEVKQIGSTISNLANPQAKVIFGVTQNEKHKDKIKITLLATGCREEKKEKPLEKSKSLKTPKPKRKSFIKEKPEELKIKELKKPEFEEKIEIKVRRNALDVKEAAQEAVQKEEKKILAKERKWETPAFFRRKPVK